MINMDGFWATGQTFQFSASLLLFSLLHKMPKLENIRPHTKALVMLCS